MSGFILHPDALADLEEIWEFIAVDNIESADRVLDEIREKMQALATFPQMGHVSCRPDFATAALSSCSEFSHCLRAG